MIEEIHLKNFKLHRDTNLKFGKITLFIGPNNSGKSSVIHAMQMLSRSFKSEKPPLFSWDSPTEYIDIREFKDIVRNKEHSLEVMVKGSVPLDRILSPSEMQTAKDFIAGEKVEFTLDWILKKDKNSYNYTVELEAYDARNISNEKKDKGYEILIGKKKQVAGHWPKIHFEPGMILRIIKEDKKIDARIEKDNWRGLGPIINLYEIPAEIKDYFSIMIEILSSQKRFIESFHFVYPIRGLEYQLYPIVGGKQSLNLENISLGERAKNIPNTFISNKEIENEVNEKIKEIIGGITFYSELEPPSSVKILSKISKDNDIPFLFEGSGSQQMLFMLIPLVRASPFDTIFIEEPENHLHPKAQYELSKLFAKFANDQNKQLVLTTHSEHIVSGFLNLVAKKELKPEDVVIYYFENDKGEAKVRNLAINEFGQVDGGLPGFFEADVNELLEFLRGPEEEEEK